jgi:2,4-dienoyl-CoA reductase (NADPH2)
MHDPLFTPVQMNTMEIKNRIVMPAMHLGMADQFQVTDQIVEFYRERARGGAGMICVGYATVDDRSGSSLNIGAHDDRFIPGLSRLASAINEHGSRSCVQLNHAGRYNFSFFMDGKTPVAPSAIPSKMTREMPRALNREEIAEIVQSFGQAAARVRQAGFDAVEILCGTGYLISEFLSPLTNEREDEYGGSLDNRLRFGLEVLGSVREEVGSDYPIVIRINGNDLMQGGLGSGEMRAIAAALTDRGGADGVCVNVGWHEARVPQITAGVPRAAFAYLARGIKEAVQVPVIASHRINDPQKARELISTEFCDLAAMGRSLIADPELPNKARSGRENEMMHCIACAQGCFDNLFQLKHVECLCNPRAGHELERNPEKTAEPKRVLVVGGGPAGMMAALTAHRRGHEVTLWEREPCLGGQLFLASVPPGREEFGHLARDLAGQVRQSGVRTVLGRDADQAAIRAESPDQVVLATGAVPMVPDIPGRDGDHVVQAWDVLLKKAWPGKRVAVIGGGAVGVETALFLAEQGTLTAEELKFLLVNQVEQCQNLQDMAGQGAREIVLVEMLDKIGRDIGKSTKWTMIQDMKRLGVQSRTGTRALEIVDRGIRVQTAEGEEIIPADTVVLAVGSRSFNPLEDAVRELGIPCSTVGDASQVGLAYDAVHQGFALGCEL